MSEGRRRRFAYAALLAAISGIAWSAIFIRWSAVPGPSSAFYRVAIAAVILVPWRIASAIASDRERARIASTPLRSYWLALLGGVFLKGFREAIGLAVIIVVAYLGLNFALLVVSFYQLVVHQVARRAQRCR